MTSKSGNTFAFPIPAWGDKKVHPGMTLRDYFAGQALAGVLADNRTSGDIETIADFCYALADGMLAARMKEQGGKALDKSLSSMSNA